MLLLEALRGGPLAPAQPLSEVLPQAVAVDPASGAPTLLRPLGRDVVGQLVAALAAAKPHASGEQKGGRLEGGERPGGLGQPRCAQSTPWFAGGVSRGCRLPTSLLGARLA